MSLVGAVGYLMGGIGIEDILGSAFVGVPKMLAGKKYPQNVRAFGLRQILQTEHKVMLSNRPSDGDVVEVGAVILGGSCEQGAAESSS